MNGNRIDILGVQVSSVLGTDVLTGIDEAVRTGRKEIFAYVNVHAANLAHRLPWFKDFLNNAAIAYADGEGIRFGAKILGYSLPEKIALTRKIWDIAALCEANGFSLYLLGGTEENAKRASENLKRKHPRLNVHAHHGYFTDGENEIVLNNIQGCKPSVLIVGLGMPKQEEWILKNFDRLDANVILPGGACIDFAADARPVCPEWISRLGFEWLYRFAFEPKRLFYRYFAGNPLFLWRIFLQRIKNGKHQIGSNERASSPVL
jgi:N-acetylglucosaminyldiphosphoundecaprenol N-acetyl-beta-D-mannosaminyltransferase